jgi:cell division protein FtsN
MITKRIVLSVCCAVVLALSACSRQQSDWQKTREANTADAYEQFLKKYPTGEFTAQAQARVKELYEERDWQKARDADTPEAYQAFLKQYPEGKWTEEARIRVENFTLAQAPSTAPGSTETAAVPPTSGGEAATVPPPAAVSTPPVSPPVAPPAKSQPKPQSPTPPAHPKAVAKAIGGSSGRYGVQLGAFKSGPKVAHERWAHLKKEYPSLLAGLSPRVAKKKTAAGVVYRLQATGLSEQHARALCKRLNAKSQACVVVPPAHG